MGVLDSLVRTFRQVPAGNLAVLAAGLDASYAPLPGAWAAYTPSWTADAVNPAIGNGILKGAWVVQGKNLFVRVTLIIGSTTTLGTGGWLFSLPSGKTARTDTGIRQVGAAWAFDVSATDLRPGICRVDSGATTMRVNISSTSGNVSGGAPWAWANTDELQLSASFEID